MKSILDPKFRYVRAAETTPEYLRAKFRKLIREQSSPPRQENVMKMKVRNGRG
jgi:hypothetical protein